MRTVFDIIPRVAPDLPVSETASAAPPGKNPAFVETMKLLESSDSAEAAIAQVQVVIFKEGLAITRETARQMLRMLESTQLLARSADVRRATERSIDVVA